MTTAGDYLGTDLPYFSSSSASSKTITSGVYQVVSTIKTSGTACNAVNAVLLNGGVPNYSCSSGIVSIIGYLTPGTNTIKINTASASVQASSNIGKNNLYDIVKWFGIILILAVGIVLISLIRSFSKGNIDTTELFKYLGLLVVGMAVAGIILVILIVIVSKVALSG
jgi:hypothetical protein